jgi:hypothetical protein
MPYITQEARVPYEKAIENIVELLALLRAETDVEGHFNYVVSSIMKRYIKKTGNKYYKCNKFSGALNCIHSEFYRRVVAPYEDEAIKKNGDI